MSEPNKLNTLSSKALTAALNDSIGFRHQEQFSSMVSYLTQNLTSQLTTRESYFNQLSTFRQNWIVNGIYDVISNDVFIDSGTLDYLSVEVTNDEAATKELKRLFEKLNIAQLLYSIFPDLLHYGSYPLRPAVETGKGITDLVDDLDPRSVISITDTKGIPLAYFVDSSIKNQNHDGMNNVYVTRSQLEYKDISSIVFLSLDLKSTKLSLDQKMTKQFKQKLPTDQKSLIPSVVKLRSSESFIWPVIDKLKETLLLDKAAVYRNIGSILTPNIIGIPVPEIFDPAQLIEITKKYDELLNSNVNRVNIAQNMELTLQELASVKVIPVVGDKSNPQSIDTGRSEPIVNSDVVKESVDKLLNALGIPPELFTGSQSDRENMKTNIRYAKKVKRIQKNLSKSLVYLALLHLSHKYPEKNFYAKDIIIQLKNNTNLDELENIEAQDLAISALTSLKNVIEEMETIIGSSSYEIDSDQAVQVIIDNFASVGSKFHTIFRKKATVDNSTTSEEINQLPELK